MQGESSGLHQRTVLLAGASFLAGACTACAVYWAISTRPCNKKYNQLPRLPPKAQAAPPPSPPAPPPPPVCEGVTGAIGRTPLIRIASLSRETGCEIYGKAEFLNPGGSVKDRVALQIVEEAFASGLMRPGSLITEGTAGSTGVSLAMVAAARGCRCFIAMPDDAAIEKVNMLRALGAEVERVRPVSISHPDHHVNVARRKALTQSQAQDQDQGQGQRQGQGQGQGQDQGQDQGQGQGKIQGQDQGQGQTQGPAQARDQGQPQSGAQTPDPAADVQPADAHWTGAPAVFADQFENLANYRAHLLTGQEIWEQTGGKVHAFVSGSGTGGTIAGVSCRLKELDPAVQVFLIDPPGSSLYNKVTRGVMYTREEAEGKRLRNPFDTITEGIGINRLTKNFDLARIDGAFKGSDREAVEMAHYLLRHEGLFIGSSAAMNCVGAVKAARQLGPGRVIVTILCDGGHRHLSKFHCPEYLAAQGLTPTAEGCGLGFVV